MVVVQNGGSTPASEENLPGEPVPKVGVEPTNNHVLLRNAALPICVLGLARVYRLARPPLNLSP